MRMSSSTRTSFVEKVVDYIVLRKDQGASQNEILEEFTDLIELGFHSLEPTPEEYFQSLTPEVENLVQAIISPKGVFILSGSEQARTNFLHFLEIIQDQKIFHTDEFSPETVSEYEIPFYQVLVENVDQMESTIKMSNTIPGSKIWIHTSMDSVGIKLNSIDSKFTFTKHWIEKCRIYLGL